MEYKERWDKIYQPYELNYWKDQGLRDYGNESFFRGWWDRIFNWIGEIKGEALDIGCGLRPPLQRGTVIEPLIAEYIEIGKQEWYEGINIVPFPGEHFVESFVDKFDFIICWNAIDHSYEPLKILENIKKYLKADGTVALATDCGINLGEAHPTLMISKEEFLKVVEKDFTIIKKEENIFYRELCLLLKKK